MLGRQETFEKHVQVLLRDLSGAERLPSKHEDVRADRLVQFYLAGAYNAVSGTEDAVSMFTDSARRLALSFCLDPSALNEEWPDEP